MARTTGNASDLITFTRASTGTFLGSNGLLQTATTNTPRVEYDANGVAKGLLIEEARTNLDPYSATQTAGGWAGAIAGDGITPTTTDVTSVLPTGDTSSVTELTLNRGTADISNYSIWRKEITITGVAHTGSIYLKAARPQDIGKTVVVYNNGGGTFDFVYVTLTDDWQRVSSVSDASSGATTAWLSIALYTTLASTGEVKMLTWGSQQEAGSFPTSYIPTSGATATRSADIASVSVSEFGYNQAQGSVVVEFSSKDDDPSPFSISDGTPTNRMLSYVNSSNIRWYILNGAASQANVASSVSYNTDTNYKAASVYAANDFAISVNGELPQIDSAGSVPTSVSLMNIGTSNSGGGPLNGHIKSINYYPLRLSDAKLQELTS